MTQQGAWCSRLRELNLVGVQLGKLLLQIEDASTQPQNGPENYQFLGPGHKPIGGYADSGSIFLPVANLLRLRFICSVESGEGALHGASAL